MDHQWMRRPRVDKEGKGTLGFFGCIVKNTRHFLQWKKVKPPHLFGTYRYPREKTRVHNKKKLRKAKGGGRADRMQALI